MGIVNSIMDWANFKTMVTPVILKILFQLIFWISNILGALFVLATLFGGLLSLGNTDSSQGSAGFIASIITSVAVFILLIVWNLYVRITFELGLLMFNVYDSVKEIEKSTKKIETKTEKK
jgi:hypothetical protein